MVTIMIPTFNRANFLNRLLDYFAIEKCPYTIAIGDSSNKEEAEKIRSKIQSLDQELDIQYNSFPGLNDSLCIKALVDSLTTKYAIFLADDDFLIPGGIKKCVDFLESHPEYVSVHGAGVLFCLKEKGPYGSLDYAHYYRQPICTHDSVAVRLINYLGDHSVVMFSVHLSQTWKKMYQHIEKMKDKTFTELLPSSLSVIYGKSKELDCLYLIRQTHPQRYLLPNVYDWLTRPQWNSTYQEFYACLRDELIQLHQLSQEEAGEIVKQAFWAYLGDQLSKKYLHWYKEKDSKSILGHLKLLLPRKNIDGRINITLSALLRKGSKYHADFSPIRDILSKQRT